MIAKDFGFAMIGLLVSIILAASGNSSIREEIYQSILNIF